jgi:hypothetical protein
MAALRSAAESKRLDRAVLFTKIEAIEVGSRRPVKGPAGRLPAAVADLQGLGWIDDRASFETAALVRSAASSG